MKIKIPEKLFCENENSPLLKTPRKRLSWTITNGTPGKGCGVRKAYICQKKHTKNVNIPDLTQH